MLFFSFSPCPSASRQGLRRPVPPFTEAGAYFSGSTSSGTASSSSTSCSRRGVRARVLPRPDRQGRAALLGLGDGGCRRRRSSRSTERAPSTGSLGGRLAHLGACVHHFPHDRAGAVHSRMMPPTTGDLAGQERVHDEVDPAVVPRRGSRSSGGLLRRRSRRSRLTFFDAAIPSSARSWGASTPWLLEQPTGSEASAPGSTPRSRASARDPGARPPRLRPGLRKPSAPIEPISSPSVDDRRSST